MNAIQVAVLLATVGLIATTNAQFGWPQLPSPPGGGGFPIPNIFNCQPIDRLFVVQGGICFQQNAIMLNCRNQSCQCIARPAPTPPTPPPGMGSPFPGFPGFPFPPIPAFPPIPQWNCAASGNSTAPTTPASSSSTSTTTTTTTTPAPPAP